MKPTYPHEVLNVKIQFATIHEIREIAGLVCREKEIYGSKVYDAIIASISKRLLMLSQSSSLANQSQHTKSSETDKVPNDNKIELAYTLPAHQVKKSTIGYIFNWRQQKAG